VLFARQEAANGGVQPIGMGEVVDPKLAMLIVLFGGIIALSHLGVGQIERIRERMTARPWRKAAPAADKI
jgi:hypothetical protein